MTIYDAVMVGLLIAGMIWGAWRGITWQLASIASLVLGYVVAYPMSEQLAPRFPGEPAVARGLALLTVYVAVSAGVFLVAWMVRATLRQWKFEAFDRHLGMILGGAEGAIVGVVATVFVISLAPQTRDPILASRSGWVVGKVLGAIQPVLPGEVREVLAKSWSGSGSVGAQVEIPEVSGPASSRFRDLFQQERRRIGGEVAREVERQANRVAEEVGRRADRAVEGYESEYKR